MTSERELVEKLTTLNHIAERLNRAVDVRGVLDHALADLVALMGLETGWITLLGPAGGGQGGGSDHVLAAHHNLPPILNPDDTAAWGGSCTCLDQCRAGRLTQAYNQVRCSRLNRDEQDGGSRDRHGLHVHASAPLRSGDSVLGILNVAAPDWSAFSSEALGLLTNVGNQMGIALERARLYDMLQKRHEQQEAALLDFSNRLLGRLDLDDLMGFLVENVRQMLYADACALLLPDPVSGALEFRAASGWHVDPAAAGHSVPNNGSSGPSLVIHTLQPLQVEDIQAYDPAPGTPLWLHEEGFRGYAVMPLQVNGHAGGALVLNQRQPRLLDQEDQHCLRLMANQAAVAIETARLHQEETKVQILEKEMAIGRQIQLSLLPGAPPAISGWEFAAHYEAAREVGGDFYDFLGLPGEPSKMGMVIADVTGKGVPAALFMARSSALIRSIGQQAGSPSATLTQANDLLCKDGPSDPLLTAFYGVLDTHSGRLVYANAGHCRPLWFQARTGKLQGLPSRGILLGAFGGVKIEEQEIDLEPGDLVILHTDGVTEARNDGLEFFDRQGLRAVVAAHAQDSPQQVLDAIVREVQAFSGAIAQQDDLTLVALRRAQAA